MSDQSKKYESVLVGWADEPSYNDNGELMGWSFRLKDNELKDCIDQYTTKRDASGQGGNVRFRLRDASGQGGNVRFRLFMSKNGKACLSVWDPNSEAAQERRNNTAKTEDTETIPF
jgi:hypothetical protein